MRNITIRYGLCVGVMAGLLALSSCNSGSDESDSGPDEPTVGAVTISHLADASAKTRSLAQSGNVLPDGIDAMQIEFEDADGQVVHGPIEVPAAPEATINDVPLSVASVTVDYLRNGGYALFTDEVPVAWSVSLGTASPEPEAASPSTTKWTAGLDDQGIASLTVSVEGGPAQGFLVKGVGYSPAPIGFSNKDGPSFGDIFWDTPGGFLDFERVWKRDMENIRAYGFNAVRTYSLIAHFINSDDGSFPDQASIDAPGSLFVRQHKKFLDEAWNNGVNPIYVIVGIPLPEELFYKPYFENPANERKIEFWDNNFTATVMQMKDHPAVLGFTLFNEIGGGPDTYVRNASYAEHFWQQIAKYAERAKTSAPDKLVGWAYFDDPDFAKDTVAYRTTYAKYVDFYGVNTFQPQDLNHALNPWLKENQAEAARPVLLTEYGLPTTVRIEGRKSENQLDLIHSTEASIKATAEVVGQVMPQAFRHPVTLGMFYFEWSDEWWKQGGGSRVEQEGGASNTTFPNGAWDEEGFGLHEVSLNGRTAEEVYADAEWKPGGNVQVDKLTPKTELLNVVKEIYRNAEQIRRQALGLQ